MVTNGYQYLQLDSNQNSLTITSIGKVKPTREMTLNVGLEEEVTQRKLYIYIYIYIHL